MAYAEKASRKSMCPRYKIGAAIFKGARLIGMGWNDNNKTHPDSRTRYNAIHAEFAAVSAMHKFDLRGATIFVFRKDRFGRLAMSKPCPACQDIIREAGITKVYYTTADGTYERL